uniref:Uncharacterized protein n=1 Tax=Anopheles atroparvus TaxID=41427 RepID=A0A182J1T5_ANOAO
MYEKLAVDVKHVHAERLRVQWALEHRVEGVLQQEDLLRPTVEQERTLQMRDLRVLDEGGRCERGSLWSRRIRKGEGGLGWGGCGRRCAVPLVDARRLAVRHEVYRQLVERAHSDGRGELRVLRDRRGHWLDRWWLRDIANARHEHVRRRGQADIVDRGVLHAGPTTPTLAVSRQDVLVLQALEVLVTSGEAGGQTLEATKRGGICVQGVCQLLQERRRFVLGRSGVVRSLHVLHGREKLTLAQRNAGDGRHEAQEGHIAATAALPSRALIFRCRSSGERIGHGNRYRFLAAGVRGV